MRLHRGTALVVCLCLWIPVAQSYEAIPPEDQDVSGDDEFSGSGSGDDDIWIFEPEVTTQASPNTTKTAWFTDAPVILPERSVTQFVTLDTEPETSGHITEASLPYTTQITETQPSLVIIKSFDSEEVQKGETTTISDVAQPETTVPPAEKLPETTVPPAEKLPMTTVPPAVLVPTQGEEYTTTAYDEEDTTESSVIDQEEDETTVVVEVVPVTTEAPDMETTPPLLSTTSASNVADPEASGDAVESTTVQAIEDNSVEKDIIVEERKPNTKKTRVDGTVSENEISRSEQPGSESDFARSDNDSLLERKEVLAGVIAGGVVGLAFAIMLVSLMVYRMKKKDEGSYSLDEHKHPNGGYQKPQKQEEFLA
ncbi:syndecan-1 [Pangasianodon hypophthalmus]|uniref:syndecan-1 n=1 Tax=Pangasianodon hypophthalmus TaxID=310915 RepID=UPI00230831A6|nr:syndecan-1 [Pangasianodon hypophthalmus]